MMAVIVLRLLLPAHHRRIRIMTDKGERPGAVGNLSPLQRRRDVLTFACVFPGHVPTGLEGRATEFQIR